MRDPSYWTDEKKLIQYLARQLVGGRLALLLGAGVSRDFGLPDWNELLRRMSDKAHLEPFNIGDNAPRRAQTIRDQSFKGNLNGFLDLVKSALYEKVSIDFAHLTTHPLLSAIGSLVMSSRRGSASTVVTLNFDDVLETYLEYFGFVVTSIIAERHWAAASDVVIYHPHGFLPLSPSRSGSGDIVLSSRDFFQAIADSPSNVWRSLLLTLLRTRTFLHIGLSGDDLNVESLMNNVQPFHAASPIEAAYNGVRFGLASDTSHSDLIQSYKGYGVYTHLLGDWGHLPNFLFKICQEARLQRIKQDNL